MFAGFSELLPKKSMTIAIKWLLVNVLSPCGYENKS